MQDTISVRADEAVKEKFEMLAQESGIGKKDFMRALIDAYELNQTKKNVPILEHDIDEVQQLTSRINNIFVNTGERLKLWEENKIQATANEIETKQGIIELLQRQVTSLNEDKTHDEERVTAFLEAKEMAENRLIESEEKVRQLQGINSKNDALIQSYKEKSEQLAKDVEYLSPLAELNTSLKSENELLRKNAEVTNKEISDLQELLKTKEKDFQERIKRETEQLTSSLIFEKEKAILELRTKHQDEIAQLQERYTDKVSELLQQREIELREKSKKLSPSKTIKQAKEQIPSE